MNTLIGQCVCVCVSPHLKVTGVEHVPNDDNFFMPLPQLSLLLWPPVQLSARTQTRKYYTQVLVEVCLSRHAEWD